ncbi:MAG: ATP synthase F0 subunit C [Calditrichia bacterium]|nr:ATP synthase F0 subunit C [Calditrichia bacterium]
MENTFHLAMAYLAAGLGAGLTIIGAALGFGKIGSQAMDATGRQPEAGNVIRTSMIILAAMLEGATFFALIVEIILAVK